MQKIKIAYVVNDLLVGGAQKLVFDLSRMLDKEKYKVTVYYLYDFEGKKVTLRNNFLEEKINIICLENVSDKRDFKSLINNCINEFTKNLPDLVHIHLPNSLIVGGIASVAKKISFIIHEHNTHSFHSWKIKLVFILLRPFSKLTICYAETVEKEVFKSAHVMKGENDFEDQKIITVLNGIDVSGMEKVSEGLVSGTDNWRSKRKSIGVEDNKKIIFSAARFVKWKGHHLLVEAFAKISNKNPDSVLVIAGEGPEKENVMNLVKELDISEKVIFLGARTDVPELLAVSDIYSLVFDYEKDMEDAEAIGIAGFEGMVVGIPTIIGEFGAAHFYIENWINGVIVKKWDTQDLSDTLDKLLNNESLRIEIGKKGKKRMYELLDWGGIIKIYHKIYKKIAVK